MPMPEFKQLVDEVKKEIKEVNQEELRRMKQAGDDLAIIDVREPEESAQGMLPGAVAIPRATLELHIDEVTTDKNQEDCLLLRRRQPVCAGYLHAAAHGIQKRDVVERRLSRLETRFWPVAACHPKLKPS